MSATGPLDERVMRRLKLRELRILTTVAQAGSMGKAAVKLAISQPAVSKAVGEMEHTLGVALLDRTAQGVEPTLYGRALLKWAIAVFDDLRQGVREIEFLADPAGGEVRVGCSEIMNTGLLPAAIDRYRGNIRVWCSQWCKLPRSRRSTAISASAALISYSGA